MNVTKEFKKSFKYKSLPQKIENEKNKIQITKNSKGEDEEIEFKYSQIKEFLSAFDRKA